MQKQNLVSFFKDKFLDELIGLIESHLSNPDMNIDYICTQIET